jgi:hypothetical protein
MGVKARETDPVKISEKRRAYQSSYREKNRELLRSKSSLYIAAWYAGNRKRKLEKDALFKQSLHDSYIISLLRRSMSLPPGQEFPRELIESKRQHLKLQRLIKEKQK